MAGPNQTGSALQSPVSSMMGYGGGGLSQQLSDEEDERRKKALRDAAGNRGLVSNSILSMMSLP